MQTSDQPSRPSTFSRRDSMRVFGLAGFAAIFGSSSTLLAQDKQATVAEGELQGAGYFKKPLGQAMLYLVSDGGFPMDPAELFGEVPSERMAEAKKEAFLSKPTVPGHVNTLLVKEGSDLILIDTGCGNNFGPTTGKLLQNLKRAGFAPTDVTHVVLTHAHPDHIGGLATADGRLAFPNAEVIINKAEHDFWTGPSPSLPKSRTPPQGVAAMAGIASKALAAARSKLRLAKPGDRVGNAITLVDAAGHTPGHVALMIESGGESLFYVTDAVHVPSLQLANPDWHIEFDSDPELAATTRRELLDRAARERLLVAGAHIPFPSFGHIVSQEGAYRFVPAVWEW